jgi:hypothetical protein
MKINDIFESTTAGSISTVAMPIGEVKKRESTKVDGLEPVAKAIKAKKKGPYMNSLIEGKMKELDYDLKNMKDAEFKKKYKMSKAEMNKSLTEEEVIESDIILVPGQGRSQKTGFIKHDPDRAEHEGETLKNSLHTIARSAMKLNKHLETKDEFPEWVSEKIGAVKAMMTSVMQYLISKGEMQHSGEIEEVRAPSTGGTIAGGVAFEDLDEADSKHPGLWANIHAKRERIKHGSGEHMRKPGSKGAPTAQAFKNSAKTSKNEGAKVDRFVKHVEKSERDAGKGKKEAENIAWATANKRGMLDNKNKKK